MITKRDNGTSTKKGPGRIHVQGVKKAPKPKPVGGAWLGQHANVSANARRAVKAEIGARQYRKQRKAAKAASQVL